MDSKPYVVSFIGMIYIYLYRQKINYQQEGTKKLESFSFPLVCVIDECFSDNVTAFLFLF